MGNSRAVGTLWQSTHNLSQAEYEEVCRLIEATVPTAIGWAGKIMQWFLSLTR
ncbi:MAG: hypothetical protein MR383_03560 [Lachnospiraceae bacterium]|nr:hypothetical protein [Lachnospiraceae bacterium]